MIIFPSSGIQIQNKPIIISNRGNTLYVGGIGPGNYTRIQDAIDDANNGDTVFVCNGNYYENVVIDKTINLIGENRDTTVIDGNKSGDVVSISADWVNITGFTIQNGGITSSDSGIQSESNFNCFSNNNISYNSVGIYLIFSSNNKIIGNNANSNNDYGIRLYYSSNNTITGNKANSNHHYGIHLYYSSNNSVSGNRADNNYYGIYLVSSSYNTISDHNATNNIFGIRLYSSSNYNTISGNNANYKYFGIYLYYSKYNTILSNSATNNIFGIRLFYSSYNTISGNNVTNNGYGFFLDYSSYNTISGNNASSNNDYGINLNSSSNYNIIFYNKFIDNTQNAYDECNNIWDNDYPSGGNFWDDYFGYDADGDGIGDTPYPIPGGDNEDRYPLIGLTNNSPPLAPIIKGSSIGKPGKSYTYTFTSTDPDGNQVSYYIDWGDETTSSWSEFQESGTAFSGNHTWDEDGEFTVKAKAKDIHGAESDWSEFTVTMPRAKLTSCSLLLNFLERFALLNLLSQKLTFFLVL
jgi:parallel beta-helix repeat protein